MNNKEEIIKEFRKLFFTYLPMSDEHKHDATHEALEIWLADIISQVQTETEKRVRRDCWKAIEALEQVTTQTEPRLISKEEALAIIQSLSPNPTNTNE